ncbi:MAG: carboxymuconolactone decarboxylase family protein [Pseudomonadales bacterium]|nr:carboxymuconolactone decarboxylase family protein [Pseudomonadales bacterium]
MKPRIQPVEAPYSENVQKDFETIMPKGMPPLAIFRTVAHNPRVLHRMISGGLLDKGSISIADRELVILRVCALTGAEYEWGVHVAGFAAKSGFNPEQISNTCEGVINSSLWSSEQQLLIRLVDELHSTSNVSEILWSELSDAYQPDQLIELVMLAGLYHAVSFVVNACHIEKEPFAPSFPGDRS